MDILHQARRKLIPSTDVVKSFYEFEHEEENQLQECLSSAFSGAVVNDYYCNNRSTADGVKFYTETGESKDQTMAPSAKVSRTIITSRNSYPNHDKLISINKPFPNIIGQSLTLKSNSHSSSRTETFPRIHLKRHDVHKPNNRNSLYSDDIQRIAQQKQGKENSGIDNEKTYTQGYGNHYFDNDNEYSKSQQLDSSSASSYHIYEYQQTDNQHHRKTVYFDTETGYKDLEKDSSSDDLTIAEKSENDISAANAVSTEQSTAATPVTSYNTCYNITNTNLPSEEHIHGGIEAPGVAEDTSSGNVSDQALAVFRATRARPQLPIYERLVLLYQDAMLSKDFDLRVQCAIYILNKLSTMPSNDIKDNDLAITTVKLLKKLAESQGMTKPGHPDAQFVLGNCYGTGVHGVKVNPDKAFNCYWLASKQYHPECTYRVAVCYEMGLGTKQNARRALEYFRKSAKMGFAPAMYKLGMILIEPGHPPDSRREGVSWLKRAIQRTSNAPDPVALHALGCAFETNGFALVPDISFAREAFMQAAELGYAPSQYRLAVAYETGDIDIPADDRLAVIWAQKAAFQGLSDAQFLISCWHLNGTLPNRVPQNNDLAYRWARQAADNGHTRAMYALACFHEYGIGVEIDKEIAEQWLHTAAANHDKIAIQRLRELKSKSQKKEKKKKKSCVIM